jgi:hypothetical protein
MEAAAAAAQAAPAVLDGVGKAATAASAVGGAVKSFKGGQGQPLANKGEMILSGKGAIDDIGGILMPKTGKNPIRRDDSTNNILSAYDQYMKAFGGR